MARPRVHDDALRDQLLDLAGLQVAGRGPDALSLRGLAITAGTSTRAVYTLFGGKPELMAELCDRASTDLGLSQRSVAVTDDPAADLMELGRNYRRWALANQHSFAILFGGAVDSILPPDFDGSPRFDSMAPLSEAVGRLLTRLGSAADADTVVLSLWVVVHGFVTLELNGLIPAPDDVVTQLFEANTRATLSAWTSGAAG
ncbi:MAG: WHG domain-containing protein [Nakamurella sp.]